MVSADIHLHSDAKITGEIGSTDSGAYVEIGFEDTQNLPSHVYTRDPKHLDEIAATATRLAAELRAAQGAKTEVA